MTSPYRTNAADTITHLRELLSKATPGPWCIEEDGFHIVNTACEHVCGEMSGASDVDALLIVAAVNALPELLDRLEKLEAALPRLVEAVNALPGLLDRLAKLERRRLLGMPHPHPTGADCSRCDEADELDEELDQ